MNTLFEALGKRNSRVPQSRISRLSLPSRHAIRAFFVQLGVFVVVRAMSGTRDRLPVGGTIERNEGKVGKEMLRYRGRTGINMHLTVASACRKSDFVTLDPNGC